MPVRNRDPDGSAPDKCEMALLLIDVINDLDFPEAKAMLDDARQMARNNAAVKSPSFARPRPVFF
jgi:hypothetical protein